MTEEVCADQSVNRDWCEPFTFRLGRFYYLLEYKLDVLVDDPRFESAFADTEWQSLEREPRLDVLQRRLFGQGEKLFEALLTVDADILLRCQRCRLVLVLSQARSRTGVVSAGLRSCAGQFHAAAPCRAPKVGL